MIVTDDNFNQLVSENPLILIDFWAEWCGPCKKMGPILDEVEKDLNIPVGKLNVDQNSLKTQEFSVISIPTMVLFKDGKPVHTMIGAMPKHKIAKELEPWL